MLNELKHYGVLGMHWGVRRYQPYGQGYKGSKGRFLGEASEKLRNDPAVKKATKKYYDTMPYERKWNKMSTKQQAKYRKIAADDAYERYGKKGNWLSKKDFENWYLYDDGDQGQGDSFTQYMMENHRKGKINANAYEQRKQKANTEYRETVENKARELVDEYSDKKIVKLNKIEKSSMVNNLLYVHSNESFGVTDYFNFDPYPDWYDDNR